MGGVCGDPEGQYSVWKSPFSLATQARLVYSSNHTGDVTINNLDLGAILMKLLIFAPKMAPLVHIHTYVDNTVAQRCYNIGSVSTASSVEPILWELSFAARRQHIYDFLRRVPGEDNKMAYTASWLTNLVAYDGFKGRRGGDDAAGGTFP